MGSTYVDIFATKGVEYLIVIAALAAFVLVWRQVMTGSSLVEQVTQHARGWFTAPAGLFHHAGHAWARVGADRPVRVGLDDFMVKLLGTPDEVRLPTPGTGVAQGGAGVVLRYGNEELEISSPVRGQVVASNLAVSQDPAAMVRDPYEAGWLFEVESSSLVEDLRGLLSGRAAADWLAGLERSLRRQMSGDLGMVLQDGGPVMAGFGRQVYGDSWPRVARALLRADPLGDADALSLLELHGPNTVEEPGAAV